MIFFENKKARFNYEIVDEIEAGIILSGWEVKAIRAKTGNLSGAWAKITDDLEVWLQSFKLSQWRFSSQDQNLARPKKLLLHKKEILRLSNKTKESSMTLVPLKIYGNKGQIKCLLGLGKGRKRHDKKQVLKERSIQKEASKSLKNL